jgi:hypothetical protein
VFNLTRQADILPNVTTLLNPFNLFNVTAINMTTFEFLDRTKKIQTDLEKIQVRAACYHNSCQLLLQSYDF